ncbi:MAG: hypothetical protein AAFQ98_00515 [Bacteroidota bacterium]
MEKTHLFEGELIFENASGFGRAIYHPQFNCIEIVLLGTLPYQANIELYKEALQKGTEVQCSHLIFNLQGMIGDRVQTRAWIVSKFVPAFFKQIKASTYYAAIVANKPNPLVKSSIDFIVGVVRTMGKRIEIKHFENQQEALNWHQNQAR